MKKIIFKKRILADNTVYLLLSDCASVLNTTVENLKTYCSDIRMVEDIGECITEDNFNIIFHQHFADSDAVEQLTHYETLDVRVKNLIKLYSIKMLFAEKDFTEKAKSYGLTIDEYLEQVDLPEEINKEKEKIRIKSNIKSRIQDYQNEIKEALDKIDNIPTEKYGIGLQTFSVIENGKIYFRTYFTGEGIFYEIMPEYLADDVWEEATVETDGTICIPSFNYRDGYLRLSKEVNRDFRNYSVIENIIYCIQNLPCCDEWHDYIEVGKGGVSLSVSKTFFVKLLNPHAFQNVYYFGGLPETEEH